MMKSYHEEERWSLIVSGIGIWITVAAWIYALYMIVIE